VSHWNPDVIPVTALVIFASSLDQFLNFPETWVLAVPHPLKSHHLKRYDNGPGLLHSFQGSIPVVVMA
jgi:hypothetical protein